MALTKFHEASCSRGPDPIWKKVWKLNVPPKVRDFAWRACCDIIPHGANLARKGVPNFRWCLRCGEMENLMHIIRDCYWAKEVWACGLGEVSVQGVLSFRDVMDRMWDSSGIKEVEKLVVICWSMWKARNALIFEKTTSPPSALCWKGHRLA